MATERLAAPQKEHRLIAPLEEQHTREMVQWQGGGNPPLASASPAGRCTHGAHLQRRHPIRHRRSGAGAREPRRGARRARRYDGGARRRSISSRSHSAPSCRGQGEPLVPWRMWLADARPHGTSTPRAAVRVLRWHLRRGPGVNRIRTVPLRGAGVPIPRHPPGDPCTHLPLQPNAGCGRTKRSSTAWGRAGPAAVGGSDIRPGGEAVEGRPEEVPEETWDWLMSLQEGEVLVIHDSSPDSC